MDCFGKERHDTLCFSPMFEIFWFFFGRRGVGNSRYPPECILEIWKARVGMVQTRDIEMSRRE